VRRVGSSTLYARLRDGAVELTLSRLPRGGGRDARPSEHSLDIPVAAGPPRITALSLGPDERFAVLGVSTDSKSYVYAVYLGAARGLKALCIDGFGSALNAQKEGPPPALTRVVWADYHALHKDATPSPDLTTQPGSARLSRAQQQRAARLQLEERESPTSSYNSGDILLLFEKVGVIFGVRLYVTPGEDLRICPHGGPHLLYISPTGVTFYSLIVHRYSNLLAGQDVGGEHPASTPSSARRASGSASSPAENMLSSLGAFVYSLGGEKAALDASGESADRVRLNELGLKLEGGATVYRFSLFLSTNLGVCVFDGRGCTVFDILLACNSGPAFRKISAFRLDGKVPLSALLADVRPIQRQLIPLLPDDNTSVVSYRQLRPVYVPLDDPLAEAITGFPDAQHESGAGLVAKAEPELDAIIYFSSLSLEASGADSISGEGAFDAEDGVEGPDAGRGAEKEFPATIFCPDFDAHRFGESVRSLLAPKERPAEGSLSDHPYVLSPRSDFDFLGTGWEELPPGKSQPVTTYSKRVEDEEKKYRFAITQLRYPRDLIRATHLSGTSASKFLDEEREYVADFFAMLPPPPGLQTEKTVRGMPISYRCINSMHCVIYRTKLELYQTLNDQLLYSYPLGDDFFCRTVVQYTPPLEGHGFDSLCLFGTLRGTTDCVGFTLEQRRPTLWYQHLCCGNHQQALLCAKGDSGALDAVNADQADRLLAVGQVIEAARLLGGLHTLKTDLHSVDADLQKLADGIGGQGVGFLRSEAPSQVVPCTALSDDAIRQLEEATLEYFLAIAGNPRVRARCLEVIDPKKWQGDPLLSSLTASDRGFLHDMICIILRLVRAFSRHLQLSRRPIQQNTLDAISEALLFFSGTVPLLPGRLLFHILVAQNSPPIIAYRLASRALAGQNLALAYLSSEPFFAAAGRPRLACGPLHDFASALSVWLPEPLAAGVPKGRDSLSSRFSVLLNIYRLFPDETQLFLEEFIDSLEQQTGEGKEDTFSDLSAEKATVLALPVFYRSVLDKERFSTDSRHRAYARGLLSYLVNALSHYKSQTIALFVLWLRGVVGDRSSEGEELYESAVSAFLSPDGQRISGPHISLVAAALHFHGRSSLISLWKRVENRAVVISGLLREREEQQFSALVGALRFSTYSGLVLLEAEAHEMGLDPVDYLSQKRTSLAIECSSILDAYVRMKYSQRPSSLIEGLEALVSALLDSDEGDLQEYPILPQEMPFEPGPLSDWLPPSRIYKILREFLLKFLLSAALDDSQSKEKQTPGQVPDPAMSLDTQTTDPQRPALTRAMAWQAAPDPTIPEVVRAALVRLDEIMYPRIKEETTGARERNANLRARYSAQTSRRPRDSESCDLPGNTYSAISTECQICRRSVLNTTYVAFPCGHTLHPSCLQRLQVSSEPNLVSPEERTEKGHVRFSLLRRMPQLPRRGPFHTRPLSSARNAASTALHPLDNKPNGQSDASYGSLLGHCPLCTGEIDGIPAPSRGELRLPQQAVQ